MADDFVYEINRVLEETYEKTVGHFGREGGSHLTPTWVLKGAADEIATLRARLSTLCSAFHARLAGLEHGNRSLRKGLERMRRRAERAEQKTRSVIRPGLSAAKIMSLSRAVNACEVTLAWAEKQSDPAMAPTIAVCKVDADTFRGLLERNSKGEGVADG